jgi:hypothetical protein
MLLRLEMPQSREKNGPGRKKSRRAVAPILSASANSNFHYK